MSVLPRVQQHPISKNAARRLAHTSVIHDGPMRHKDGKVRHVTWLRLHMGYTDRSKYNGDGTLKRPIRDWLKKRHFL